MWFDITKHKELSQVQINLMNYTHTQNKDPDRTQSNKENKYFERDTHQTIQLWSFCCALQKFVIYNVGVLYSVCLI